VQKKIAVNYRYNCIISGVVKQDVCVLAILVFLLNQEILILVIGANNVKSEILTVVATICSVVYHFLRSMLPPY